MVVETFGQRLRRLREDAGLSQSKLAALVPISQASLSRYESDDQAADPTTAARLDELLNARGGLRGLLAGATLNGGVDRERLDRIAQQPRTIDRAGLDALAAVLATTRRLEDVIGAAPVFEPVRGYLTFVTSLASEARGSIRRDVVDLAGQWAEYAGWLHTALERYDDANMWFGRSLEWAIEAEDDDLAATVWSFKGHVAWLLGQTGPTIGLSQVAQRYRDIYPGQLAYDALQEARGHATEGNAYAVERKVDESHELAERALLELAGAPPWHYYRSPAFWDLERGRALYQLPGHAQQAVDFLTGGLGALPDGQVDADWVTAYRRDLSAAQALCA
jgi:transcriptional regulator with XRE-family HTH domain